MGRPRRIRYTPEFKAEAVRVVQQSGKSIAMVVRELDLTDTALRRWVEQAEVDAGRGRDGGADVGRARRVGAAAARGSHAADGA
jgi:transposase